MATTLPKPAGEGFPQRPQALSLDLFQTGWTAWLSLTAVFVLALGLNTYSLSQTGLGNTYYAAAARSMSENWHNFFFASFDQGGFITVDKPPVFLWFDALSVRILGYSSWSLLLPSAIAGALGVGLLWLIVKRWFGATAATIAGVVLAFTPVAVAVNRLNLPEPFYILFLIGAAGCILRSLESKRWWAWVIGAGILVGFAFNTKMLAAWIPGPALALALIVGIPIGLKTAMPTVLRQILPRLVLFGAMALIASASWMLAVDNWPGDRPYIGGSTDNTVQDLVLGYNGLGRVEGETGAGGFGGGSRTAPPQGNGRTFPDGGNATQNRPTNRGAGDGGGIGGAGGIIAGQPDISRMFDAANGAQIAWFIPFALIGGVVSLWRWRSQPVLRASIVLFLGWVVLFGGVFSYAQGIYHSYYTSALAPGLAALVGISTVGVTDLMRRNRQWVLAIAAMVIATVWVQLLITGRYEDHLNWLRPFGGVIAVLGLGVLAVALVWWKRIPLIAGPLLALGGLLLIPAFWSGYEATHASLNTTLPQAGPREGAAGRSFGSDSFDSGTAQLAAWLQDQNDSSVTWDLVVSSAQNASTLIARYDLSVLAIGGFSGRDPSLTAVGFADLVAEGKVRYVLTTGGMGGVGFRNDGMPDGARTLPDGTNRSLPGNPAGNLPRGSFDGTGNLPGAQIGGSSSAGANAVFAAVTSVCTPITDRSLPSQYQSGLYDCADKAEELAAH